MSDKDAGSIGKEINTPDMNTRKDAWQQLHDAKPADIKALAAEVTQKTDLHALGLDGFHLDEAKPATLLAVDATHNVQAFKFANGNKVVYMLPSGTEFDASATQLRNPDVPEAAKAPDAGKQPGDPTDKTPAAGPPAKTGDATGTLSDADKAKVQQLIQKNVEDAAVSVPIKKGEGYYQVIRRMHPEMKPEDAVKAARHMRELNGGNVNLKVGDKLPLMSDDEKKAAAQQAMDDFNKLSPADQASAIAQAKAAFPDTPAPTKAGDPPPDPTKAGDPPPPPTKPGDPPPSPTKPGDPPPDPVKPVDVPLPPALAKTTVDQPLTDPSTPVVWNPSLDATSENLQPKPDPKNPADLIYNPLAPKGLAEGTPGQNLATTTGGVDERTVTPSADKSGEKIDGKIADQAWNHWWDTTFTTNDTLANGKLTGRVTEYSSDRVNMTFQAPDGKAPIAIDGVKTVSTTVDAKAKQYTTTVTNSDGKTWTFQSNEQGVVTSAQANS